MVLSDLERRGVRDFFSSISVAYNFDLERPAKFGMVTRGGGRVSRKSATSNHKGRVKSIGIGDTFVCCITLQLLRWPNKLQELP